MGRNQPKRRSRLHPFRLPTCCYCKYIAANSASRVLLKELMCFSAMWIAGFCGVAMFLASRVLGKRVLVGPKRIGARRIAYAGLGYMKFILRPSL